MLNWKDGQPFSDRYGDVYFSTDSGLEETRHVFLQGNRLAERFAALQAGESFTIGETGLGTGLNFLCAWLLFEQVAPEGTSLDFFSVERFPLEDDELRAALVLWPELQEPAATLLARWHRRVPGWNRWSFAGGRVRLTLALEDVAQALPQLPAGSVEAWFLDGFSPARNHEMWSDVVLANIARTSRDGATLATYTSAGRVRRGLQQAGFVVERAPGFGHKREMVKGMLVREGCSPIPTLPPVGEEPGFPLPTGEELRVGERPLQSAKRNKPPTTALIIGGGIAGCATAHALAQRGINVTLIERAPTLASAASGNPRGILHARFGAGMVPLHRFVLAAYGHMLALLDEVAPVDNVTRAECGLLQLAATEAETKRIAKLSVLEWPAHLLQAVDAATASELAGLPMTHGGLWFPAGGWVVPPRVCARLVDHPRITQSLGCEVTELTRTTSGWRASGEGFEIEAEQVVVCSGYQAKKLSQFAACPLQAVRGQISILPATAASEKMRVVLCAEGYCAPAVAGQHVAGATTKFDEEAIDLREADHADNIAKIAEHMTSLHQALSNSVRPDPSTSSGLKAVVEGTNGAPFIEERLNIFPLAGRAGVRCSVPGAMPLVGEVEPGLYCSLAHGTRGLLTAGIAGEVIAAAMCGQLAPLPQLLLDALAPLPRARNKG